MKLLLAVDLRSDADALIARALPWIAALDATVDVLFVAADAGVNERESLEALLQRIPEAHRGCARVESNAHVATTVGRVSAGYELVAVGAARDPEAASYWLGSVTERVARSCPRSVLVVREPAPRTPAPRLLFAVDPTEDTTSLLAAVARWAARMHATVDLLTVDELAPAHHVEKPAWDEMLSRAAETYRRQHTVALEDMRDRALAPANRGEVFVDRAGAAAGIVERGHGYDLIAVGTHGRGTVARALLGSVAERVARRAATSVLVVRG